MKVDITMPEQEQSPFPVPAVQPFQQYAVGDIAIDISQVLQANQMLLKKMARKMETMESRLHSLENTISEQVRMLETQLPERLLLAAPAPKVEAWQPSFHQLDDHYFAGFSWIDRMFFPQKLRRSGVED